MAVETFFHARPGSPLLRGITDDDFITWFDKTQISSLKTSANIDNICECGRICSRDYEFRKDYEKMHEPKSTEETSTTTDISASTESITISDDISTSTEQTSTHIAISYDVTVSTSVESVSHKITSAPLNSFHENNTFVTTTALQNNELSTTSSDEPIIIPTVTYVNDSKSQNIDNNIQPNVPKINGELIIQKIPVSKTYVKKPEHKKPLPRRKGTLKATYGDKHDKFFIKSKPIETTSIENVTNNSVENNGVKTTKPLKVLNNEITTHEPVILRQEKKKLKFSSNSSLDSSEDDQNKIIQTTRSADIKINPETTSIPHTIAAITKSNIKTMHYRTKKPKPKNQIKKPISHSSQSEEKHVDDNKTVKPDIVVNETKIKVITDKYEPKPLKSINKEIHKIPSTPVSETSKAFNNPLKVDIAPENRGGFEILDKNDLWELLKEGTDHNSSKIDDKIQFHNRLSDVSNLTQNNSSRSL